MYTELCPLLLLQFEWGVMEALLTLDLLCTSRVSWCLLYCALSYLPLILINCIWPTEHHAVVCAAHGCCSFRWEGSWFMYVFGRSEVFNIMMPPTSRMYGLRLLFVSPIRLSGGWQRQSWASSKEACNHSNDTTPCRLHISSLRYWPARNSDGINGMYDRSS